MKRIIILAAITAACWAGATKILLSQDAPELVTEEGMVSWISDGKFMSADSPGLPYDPAVLKITDIDGNPVTNLSELHPPFLARITYYKEGNRRDGVKVTWTKLQVLTEFRVDSYNRLQPVRSVPEKAAENKELQDMLNAEER